MLGGELGDKLNAILAAVGFNLVKRMNMKGLKERWFKRLFLCLQAMADGMARVLAHVCDWFAAPSFPERQPSVVAPCCRPRCGNCGFA